MTTWIPGTEESTIAAVAGGLPGRGSAAATPPREPAGTWHAVDPATGDPACGSDRFLEVWPTRRWREEGVADRCAECVAAVPLDPG